MATVIERFTYADGYPGRVPAEVAGPELLRLADALGFSDHEGLSAEEVVEAARPSDSPLHEAFEWDDHEAAEEYRREQARGLVRNLRLDIVHADGAPRSHRVFVNLEDGEGYRTTVAVERAPALRARLLRLALGDVRSAKARLSELRGLDEVVDQLESVERRILGEM